MNTVLALIILSLLRIALPVSLLLSLGTRLNARWSLGVR